MNLNSIKKRKPRTSRVDSLVGKKARVLGEIRFSEGLHIDGLIKGNVVSDDDQPATLSVSDSGTIEGHVKVPNVIISGTVKAMYILLNTSNSALPQELKAMFIMV